jgi:hypothetical protein
MRQKALGKHHTTPANIRAAELYRFFPENHWNLLTIHPSTHTPTPGARHTAHPRRTRNKSAHLIHQARLLGPRARRALGGQRRPCARVCGNTATCTAGERERERALRMRRPPSAAVCVCCPPRRRAGTTAPSPSRRSLFANKKIVPRASSLEYSPTDQNLKVYWPATRPASQQCGRCRNERQKITPRISDNNAQRPL